MIDKAYDKAALLHGHRCPGLAIGVRAAQEARRLLPFSEQDVEERQIYCLAEGRACYLDGIQALSGCTVGNGHLLIRSTGTAAFSFYHLGREAGLRLALKPLDDTLSREEKTRRILHAPAEEIFLLSSPTLPLSAVLAAEP